MREAPATLTHGTTAWFEMAGALMCEHALRADLPPDLTVSFVERYTDGGTFPDGLVQGLRFDIVEGKPSFGVGVRSDERADVVVEITAAAAHQLNKLHSADPAYQETLDRIDATGQRRTTGDPSRLGDWLGAVHDPMVDRTA